MGTIPFDPEHPLTARQMRERIEDKATLRHPGSMYVGGTNEETAELEPGNYVYWPLVSKGSGRIPDYVQLSAGGFMDAAITKEKIGPFGTIVQKTNDNKKTFNVSYTSGQQEGTPDKITVSFGNTSYTLGNDKNNMSFNNGTTVQQYPVVKFIGENSQEAVWCRSDKIIETIDGVGISNITCNRTGNQYSANISSGNLVSNDTIYFGDNITINYTLKQKYSGSCYLNNVAIASGQSINVNQQGPVNLQFRSEPDEFDFKVTTGESLDLSQVIIRRLSSNKVGAPLGILQPIAAGSTNIYKVYEDDVVQFETSAVIPTDKQLKCYNEALHQLSQFVPTYQPLTVSSDFRTYENVSSCREIRLSFGIDYIYYSVNFRVNEGVYYIRYKYTDDHTANPWHYLYSTTTIQVQSGRGIQYNFRTENNYIGDINSFRYDSRIDIGSTQSITVNAVRSNITWSPRTIAQASYISATATWKRTGNPNMSTDKTTYTMAVTNLTEDNTLSLVESNVPIIVRGAQPRPGLTALYTHTSNRWETVSDTRCFVSYTYNGTTYGTIGTYTEGTN